MIIIYFIFKNNLKKGRNKTEFVELYGPKQLRLYRRNFATARSAQPHRSDRCAQKADPYPLFKGVSQILLCDEFYSGIFSLNGMDVCAE